MLAWLQASSLICQSLVFLAGLVKVNFLFFPIINGKGGNPNIPVLGAVIFQRGSVELEGKLGSCLIGPIIIPFIACAVAAPVPSPCIVELMLPCPCHRVIENRSFHACGNFHPVYINIKIRRAAILFPGYTDGQGMLPWL